MLENVTGMVLSASPISEYDKRLVLLTKEYGRISAFAQGARKSNSPLLACSQPFTFGKFKIYRGRNSFKVNSVTVENYFTELRDDLDSVYYAYYFCEMADYFTDENLDGTEILKLLYQSFRALRAPSLKNELIRIIVELKMLVMNGEAPRVYDCVKCGTKKELHLFVAEDQGLYCNECKNKKNGIMISEATLYTLQRIVSSECRSLFTFTVSDAVLYELKLVVGKYMRNRVDKKFHSIEMIEMLKGGGSV